MITSTNQNTFDFRGLSTDNKPIEGVGNGSTLIEMDTGNVFLFDAFTKTWREI